MNARWMNTGALALLALVAVAGCAHGPPAPERPWIRNVKFRGAGHLSASELRKGLENQETSWFTLRRKHYYSPSALVDDRLRVAATFESHGFFDARVTATEVKPRWRGSVDLYFTVDEGQESRITEVRVRGLEPL